MVLARMSARSGAELTKVVIDALRQETIEKQSRKNRNNNG
jgi:hypothetical protein